MESSRNASSREFNKSVGWQRKTTFLAKILFILQHNLLSAQYIQSNDLLTFRCLSCHRFPIWPIHLMKISVSGAISSSLGTVKSLWGPNLVNKMGDEAIWSVMSWFFPSFLLIYELVRCLEKRLFACCFDSDV